MITSNNIKIYSKEEAKELLSIAKEQSSKSEDGADDQEKTSRKQMIPKIIFKRYGSRASE